MYKKPQKHHYETSKRALDISVLISAVTLFSILAYYVANGRPVSIDFINRAFAIGSVFLIGTSYLLGPLARLLPKIIIPRLEYRKPLGMFGYWFAISHILISLVISDEVANGLSLFFGMIAILVFTLIASLSLVKSISSFGFKKWQTIQRLGYIAFLLVILHFAVLGNGQFISRQLGQITLTFALLVILARTSTLVIWKK